MVPCDLVVLLETIPPSVTKMHFCSYMTLWVEVYNKCPYKALGKANMHT